MEMGLNIRAAMLTVCFLGVLALGFVISRIYRLQNFTSVALLSVMMYGNETWGIQMRHSVCMKVQFLD